ncbi:hypothetical protein MJH12_12940, partial [bacterium]|nr:hypothetical protein [bacterium]
KSIRVDSLNFIILFEAYIAIRSFNVPLNSYITSTHGGSAWIEVNYFLNIKKTFQHCKEDKESKVIERNTTKQKQ